MSNRGESRTPDVPASSVPDGQGVLGRFGDKWYMSVNKTWKPANKKEIAHLEQHGGYDPHKHASDAKKGRLASSSSALSSSASSSTSSKKGSSRRSSTRPSFYPNVSSIPDDDDGETSVQKPAVSTVVATLDRSDDDSEPDDKPKRAPVAHKYPPKPSTKSTYRPIVGTTIRPATKPAKTTSKPSAAKKDDPDSDSDRDRDNDRERERDAEDDAETGSPIWCRSTHAPPATIEHDADSLATDWKTQEIDDEPLYLPALVVAGGGAAPSNIASAGATESTTNGFNYDPDTVPTPAPATYPTRTGAAMMDIDTHVSLPDPASTHTTNYAPVRLIQALPPISKISLPMATWSSLFTHASPSVTSRPKTHGVSTR